jgi:hypothetical protein
VVKEVQADILCCQEPNVNVTQPMVRNILYQTARHHWKRARLSVGSSPTPFVSMYKPGGTMVLSTGNITGRLTATEADKWGRWTSQTLRGHNDRKITIVSAYQVVENDPEKGVILAAMQQQSLLQQSQDPLNDPRKAFQRPVTYARGRHCLDYGYATPRVAQAFHSAAMNRSTLVFTRIIGRITLTLIHPNCLAHPLQHWRKLVTESYIPLTCHKSPNI